MDPLNQIRDINTQFTNDMVRKEMLRDYVLSDECVVILEKPEKTREMYSAFIDARFKEVVSVLSKCEFKLSDEGFEDDVASD